VSSVPQAPEDLGRPPLAQAALDRAQLEQVALDLDQVAVERVRPLAQTPTRICSCCYVYRLRFRPSNRCTHDHQRLRDLDCDVDNCVYERVELWHADY